ncbi:MAG: type I restriction endonuclease [Chlorobiaceae bacterium]|nr:type I restriction endonuclease [Chlorobiaceae bacterium]
MPIIAPPLDLQNQFANIVEKVESIKSRYQQSLTDLETLYSALSQKAFKGELDLSSVLVPQDDA